MSQLVNLIDFNRFKVPLHITLTKNSSSNYGSPVFLNTNASIIYISNYVHVGSYISSVIAYDSSQKDLIKSYTISSSLQSNYFNIDPITGLIINLSDIHISKKKKSRFYIQLIGIISLNQNFNVSNPIYSTQIPITVTATSLSGLTSSITYQMDCSALSQNNIAIQFQNNVN